MSCCEPYWTVYDVTQFLAVKPQFVTVVDWKCSGLTVLKPVQQHVLWGDANLKSKIIMHDVTWILECSASWPACQRFIDLKHDMNMFNWQQISSPCSFIPCSERIHVAVTEMAGLFPKVRQGSLCTQRIRGVILKVFIEVQVHWGKAYSNSPLQKPRSDTVRGSLRLLTSSAYRLQSECRKALPSEGCPGPDMQLVTQQVIQCAYDIAKAAKQLVTITTKENTN